MYIVVSLGCIVTLVVAAVAAAAVLFTTVVSNDYDGYSTQHPFATVWVI